jgi:hypothetical protein
VGRRKHQQTQGVFYETAAATEIRVTKLNEFSPIRRLLTSGSFLKITEAAHIFWQLYSTVKVLYLHVNMYWLHFGHFFTNSSGHPD